MSGFDDGGSYREQADHVDAFIQHVFRVGDRFRVRDDDARKRMLDGVASAAGLGVTLLGLLDLLESAPPEIAWRILRVARPEFAEYAYSDVVRSAKLFLLAEASFHFQRGLTNVLCALDPGNTRASLREVLAGFGVPDPEKKRAPFLVVASLRDALHANGVHCSRDGANRTFWLREVEYTFRQGLRIRCDSWGHVLHALTGSLQVVEEVLSSAPAAALPFVVDSYWPDAAS